MCTAVCYRLAVAAVSNMQFSHVLRSRVYILLVLLLIVRLYSTAVPILNTASSTGVLAMKITTRYHCCRLLKTAA